MMKPTFEELLNDLYGSEINISIETFFDRGYTIKFGDDINGFKKEITLYTLTGIKSFLIDKGKELYPESEFAKKYQDF